MLQQYLVAKIGFDTAENELSKVCRKGLTPNTYYLDSLLPAQSRIGRTASSCAFLIWISIFCGWEFLQRPCAFFFSRQLFSSLSIS